MADSPAPEAEPADASEVGDAVGAGASAEGLAGIGAPEPRPALRGITGGQALLGVGFVFLVGLLIGIGIGLGL